MRREDMADLAAFAVVVEERNFTRAATRLGLSQSALSQIVKRLEERLGVPLPGHALFRLLQKKVRFEWRTF